MNIKSITLTFDEIEDLLSIDDPELRRQAVRAMRNAADNPDAIDLKTIRKDKSTTSKIIRKIHRKANGVRRRAVKKAEKKPVTPPAGPEYIYVDYHFTPDKSVKISHAYFNLGYDMKILKELIADCDTGDKQWENLVERFMKSIDSFVTPLLRYVDDTYKAPEDERLRIDRIIRIPVYNPCYRAS